MTALRVADASATVKSIADIPGWFPEIDQYVFEHFLSPGAVVPAGDLVELGVYLGKSAAFIGGFRRDGEVFTVCDLFGRPPDDGSNIRENAKSYADLDRRSFERNYLALFDELPVIVEDLSSAIVDHVAAGSVRFLHVDASHMYEQVVVDIDSARTLLLPDGVVAFDDFRSAHTPGVSAAVWEAVFTKGLQPICLTQQKLYATFGDRAAHQAGLEAWLGRSEHLWSETQLIAGTPVLRVSVKPTPQASPPPRAKAAMHQDRLGKRISMLEKKVFQLEMKAAQRPPTSTADGAAGSVLARMMRGRIRLPRRSPRS
jgi:methyltransferase family protein